MPRLSQQDTDARLVGSRLRILRDRYDFSVDQVSEALGWPKGSVYNLERGLCYVKPADIQKLADFFKVEARHWLDPGEQARFERTDEEFREHLRNQDPRVHSMIDKMAAGNPKLENWRERVGLAPARKDAGRYQRVQDDLVELQKQIQAGAAEALEESEQWLQAKKEKELQP